MNYLLEVVTSAAKKLAGKLVALDSGRFTSVLK